MIGPDPVDGECTCGCHDDPSIVHSVACCRKCPHCMKNIEAVFFDSHIADHQRATELELQVQVLFPVLPLNW